MMKTPRTTLRHKPGLARYDQESLYALLDEALVSNLGMVVDGKPYTIPILHARMDDTLYLHGYPGSRGLQYLEEGGEACLTTTIVDGLVVARSAFSMNLNYRSAIIYGGASQVLDLDEKAAAMEVVVEAMVPGVTVDARPASASELRATTVLAMPLTEASVKIRDEGAVDNPRDRLLPHWAGVIPVHTVFGPPRSASDLMPGVEIPSYVTEYRRPVKVVSTEVQTAVNGLLETAALAEETATVPVRVNSPTVSSRSNATI